MYQTINIPDNDLFLILNLIIFLANLFIIYRVSQLEEEIYETTKKTQHKFVHIKYLLKNIKFAKDRQL